MGVAALAATLVILFGGVLRHDRVAIASSALPAAVVDQLQRGFATGDTAALVTGLQSELKADPGSVKTWGSLGLAYEQRARETGDASYYGKAEGALRRALGLRPHDLVATAALGQLALSRHRFREALAARPARAVDLTDHRRRLRRDRRRGDRTRALRPPLSETSTGCRRSSRTSPRTLASRMRGS